MKDLVLGILGFLFKFLLFVLTGEWPGNDDAQPTPVPRNRAPRPGPPKAWPAAQPKLDVAQVAKTQRAVEPSGRMLADVDTVLQALAEPLVEHARSESLVLPSLTFLSVIDLKGRQTLQTQDGTTLAAVSVSSNFVDMPERWVFLARHVARTLFDSLEGFEEELRRTYRLAPSLFLPPEHAAYDADSARAALGVWFPELFSDVYATYVLGPAYAAQLTRSLSRPKQPMETVIGRAAGRFLAAAPPSVLRVHAALYVLTQLGFHDWYSTLEERWNRAHPEQDTLYLPLADGRLMAVPLAFMLDELDGILKGLLEDPQDALAGETWLDIPGFAFLHAEQSKAELTAQKLLRGEAVDAPPRVLIAAAALALDGGMRARPDVATALARSLRGQGTLEAAPSAFNTPAASAGHGLSLAAAFRDRQVVRDALLIGAAFTPIKRRSSRF